MLLSDFELPAKLKTLRVENLDWFCDLTIAYCAPRQLPMKSNRTPQVSPANFNQTSQGREQK